LPSLESRPIKIDGKFDDWREVQPEFRDTIGDQVRREHHGWATNVTYRNFSGRNDIVSAKVSWNKTTASFYVRTREPVTPPGGSNWMVLFLDTDSNVKTGWLGYDFVLNHAGIGMLERNVGGSFTWTPAGKVKWNMQGNELELAIPWRALGLKSPPATLDFKWADNCLQAGDWTDFTLNGDAAPNDRFNYRAVRPTK
jgi:outer membrane protein assembly factor BamA